MGDFSSLMSVALTAQLCSLTLIFRLSENIRMMLNNARRGANGKTRLLRVFTSSTAETERARARDIWAGNRD